MPTNIVENIFEDFSVLIKYLEENNEISLKMKQTIILRKYLY